jgi:hypothetical protein
MQCFFIGLYDNLELFKPLFDSPGFICYQKKISCFFNKFSQVRQDGLSREREMRSERRSADENAQSLQVSRV